LDLKFPRRAGGKWGGNFKSTALAAGERVRECRRVSQTQTAWLSTATRANLPAGSETGRDRSRSGRAAKVGQHHDEPTWSLGALGYGWPYAYIGKHPQPGFASLAPQKVEATITPDLLFEAHSSVLDLVFYDADRFPSEYKGHAFVALKGSWNRSEPTGYKVVRVPFKDGRPEGYYENFATGFWASGERRAEVWGVPPRSPSPGTARC
jgi:hypothetical protein